MSFHIGVFGSGTDDLPEDTLAKARVVGKSIAQQGGVLVTGACYGLPHQAAKAAAEKGGLVLGFSPAANLAEHVEMKKYPIDPFYLFIFTGMGTKGRNVISVRSCQAAVFISGRMGTLNEFTIAYDEFLAGSVIGVLMHTGGAADEIMSLVRKFNKGTQATLIYDAHPANLVERVFNLLKTRQ